MPKTGIAKRERADDLLDAGRHRLGWLGTVDQLELALLPVVADQGRGLLEEDLEPVVDDALAVVTAVSKAESLPNGLWVQLQVEDGIERPVERRQHGVQRLGLGDGPGEAVEDEALLGI